MKHNLLSYFLAMVFVVPCFGDSVKDKHEQMLFPTVRIKTKRATGSGTIIYSSDRDEKNQFDTFVFTNHHVVDDAIRVEKRWNSLLRRNEDKEVTDRVAVEVFNYQPQGTTAGRTVYDAEIVAYEPEEDIALLRLTTPVRLKYVAKLIDRKRLVQLRMFNEVYAVGCSLGQDPVASHGMLTGLSVIIAHRNYWMMSAPIIFGNSGGAVFVNIDGQHYFTGIPSRVGSTYNQAVEHMAYFIPPTRIYSWLEKQRLTFLFDETVTPNESFDERRKLRQKSRHEPEGYESPSLTEDDIYGP